MKVQQQYFSAEAQNENITYTLPKVSKSLLFLMGFP